METSAAQRAGAAETPGVEPAAGGGGGTPAGRLPSVIVLTKNEEANIGPCLEGLSFSDDIVVLDSGSTDRTLEIARRYPNVRVEHRDWDTEYKQRNYGLEGVTYKNRWVYICDADERVDEELRAEILRIAADEGAPHAAYRVRYKNMFMGRWIKRSSGYPVWIIRLVRPEKVRYEVRETNVHPIVAGTVGELSGHFIHYSFNAGLRRWFEKHNYYSDREAREAVMLRRRAGVALGDLFAGDPMRRRRAFKNVSFRLRGRFFLRFIYQYFFRLGLLDGAAGLHYCLMISMYEYWIEAKVIEAERAWPARRDAAVHALTREVLA